MPEDLVREMNGWLLREMNSSLILTWHTTAPFAIGKVRTEKVGFAQIPSVVVDVYCPERNISDLVPIVRQRIYGELAERGWGTEDIEFTPGVRTERVRMFVDENDRSESLGRKKRGRHHVFRWEIINPELRKASFPRGSFGVLPTRGAVLP